MTIIIDTNIAIHLRDETRSIGLQIAALPEPISISVVTQVELEGGVFRNPPMAGRRRIKLDEMIANISIHRFGAEEAKRYGEIVAACGYSRGRTLDRMIAATAIVQGATLITANGADFLEIPRLRLEIWEA